MPSAPASVASTTSSSDHQHDQAMERHAERAQGADHAAPLLESKADGAVDDEDADREAEEAERREVEVEAVGEPADIGRAVRTLEHEVRRDLGQRPLPKGLAPAGRSGG